MSCNRNHQGLNSLLMALFVAMLQQIPGRHLNKAIIVIPYGLLF